LRDRPRSDRAAGAGAIVDDNGLAKLIADALADQSRQNVGDAAGTGRHDHLDGARRVILRHRAGRQSEHKANGGPGPLPSGSPHQPHHDVIRRIRASIPRPLVFFSVFVDRISGLSWQCWKSQHEPSLFLKQTIPASGLRCFRRRATS